MEATVTHGYIKYSGNVTIPETVANSGRTYDVTSIGEGAFAGCNVLTSVTIPHSVTTIGRCAFAGCESLTSVTIPNSVTTIGKCIFYVCNGLTSILVENGNTVYDSRDHCNAIINTATNTLIVGCKNTIIPNSVTVIGEAAFMDCRVLAAVTIPNSVTTIEEAAFLNCSGLTSLTIPHSVTTIGVGAFLGCRGLTDVFCNAEIIPKTASSAFFDLPILSVTLHVPAASLKKYKKKMPWKGFGSIVSYE